MSLPAWGAWIEIADTTKTPNNGMSLPAWGAWIEILTGILIMTLNGVAPRMGSVD